VLLQAFEQSLLLPLFHVYQQFSMQGLDVVVNKSVLTPKDRSEERMAQELGYMLSSDRKRGSLAVGPQVLIDAEDFLDAALEASKERERDSSFLPGLGQNRR
jgi:hypothetical protein